MLVPIGKKPAQGDHESDDENSILLLTNFILFLSIYNLPDSQIYLAIIIGGTLSVLYPFIETEESVF